MARRVNSVVHFGLTGLLPGCARGGGAEEKFNPELHPLLVSEPVKLDDSQRATYPGDRSGDALPVTWSMKFDGGRKYYGALAHRKEDCANPILYKHLPGILMGHGERLRKTKGRS
jgi:hypothetical protein